MPFFLNNLFVYLGIAIFAFLFLVGLNDLSFSLNLLNVDNLLNIDTRLIVMFLLAEPHFAMTIPLIYGYRKNFYLKPFIFLYVPFVIILTASIIFFYFPNFFFLLFLIANVYHVNRQSVGFFKLQTKGSLISAKLYEINLHILTVICLFFAMINKTHSISIALIIFIVSLIFMTLVVKYFDKKFLNIREIFVTCQGFLIFIPIVIFEDILLAFAVGISIHYIQYLAISWKILRKGFGFSLLPLLLILILYSMFSTGALSGLMTTQRISLIVFVPTLLQLMHFYYDAFIWQRSDTIVNNTMKKAFSK